MFLLVICQILGHFVKTLTANEKFCLRDTKVLPEPIQMLLLKEQVNSRSNFEHFDKKDHPHRAYILEVTEYKRRG